MIVDLFSGTRGWSEGLLQLGHHDIGLEWDADACATAVAAGHATIRADVEQYPCEPFVGKVDGLIASPPCTDWSTAGQQRRWDGESGRLVLEVERWVRALRPRWVACEQVPPALEVWVRFAHDFTALGYRCWAGMLNAADFGVPQTRRRAFLLCSLEKEPHPPAPTHARSPEPVLFGEALLPWVSMADALGWSDGRVGFPRRDDRGDSPDGYRVRDVRDVPDPSFAVTEKARSWSVRSGSSVAGGPLAERDGDEPAFTVTSRTDLWVRTGANSMKHSRDPDDIVPYERPVTEPAPTLDSKVGSAWTIDRRNNGAPVGKGVWDVRDPDGEKVRITIKDALVLQSFRADYPLVGNRTSQFRQVGNAVPPLLARHVLAALL